MTASYLIFRKGLLIEETNRWYSQDQEVGDYVLAQHSGAWYVVLPSRKPMPVNRCDVPKELKAYLLLMGNA